MLLYYDDETEDNCRWCIYDGYSTIRCTSRKSAIDFIRATVLQSRNEKYINSLLDARMSFAHAMHQLEVAACETADTTQLRLQRIAVKIRPVLTEIDNVLLPLYDKNKKV